MTAHEDESDYKAGVEECPRHGGLMFNDNASCACPPGPPPATEFDQITDEEQKAIRSLERLAKRWPKTLTLASMGGSLVVVHGRDPRWLDDSGDRSRAILWDDLGGIPNTGGDW